MTGIFEIVAEMVEPVCIVNPVVHLDGILAFGAFRLSSEKFKRSLPPISGPWAVDFDLPLERWELPATAPAPADDRLFAGPTTTTDDAIVKGSVWGWRCSAARLGQHMTGQHEVRKRPAYDDITKYTESRRLNISAGPVRARDRKYPTIFAHELRWCAEGDPDEALKLAKAVHGIGKLVGHGMGAVKSWSVAEAGEDWVMDRTLPAHDSPLLFGIRAPYHHPSRQVYARAWDAV